MGHRKTISSADFDTMLKNASRRIFRVESLPEYNVPGDRALFTSFVSGVLLPPVTSSTTMQWFGSIRGHQEKGVSFQRLRLMPEQITPYLRYEIDWCYSYSHEFGEETRFHPLDSVPDFLKSDFYVVDDSRLIHIEYGSDGSFSGLSEELDPKHTQSLVAGSSELWEKAIRLKQFLASYRQRSI